MTQQKTINKYYNVLKELKSTISKDEPIKMQDFINSHNISTNFWTILKTENIIVKYGKGYKWIGDDVSLQMASDVIESISDYKHIKKAFVKQRETSDKTLHKYRNALEDLYFLLKFSNDISIDEFCATKHIGKSLSGILQRINVIKYDSGKWFWIGEKPSHDMVKMIFNKRKELTKKSTIEPKDISPITDDEQATLNLLKATYNKFAELQYHKQHDKLKFFDCINTCENIIKICAFHRKYPDEDNKQEF